MNNMDKSKLRDVVNGTLLQKFIGKPVSLFGYVARVNRMGTSFDLRTTDNMTVTVNLAQPLNENIEGVVEVIGTCTGKDSVAADEYLVCDSAQSNDFNVDACNQAVLLLNTVPDALASG